MDTVHASCVAGPVGAVLLSGPSGAGKSATALGLIARGALLIADDRVRLEPRDGALMARAPAALSGRIEARGVGLLRMPVQAEAHVVLHVDLARAPVGRMSNPLTWSAHGIDIPSIAGKDIGSLADIVWICLNDAASLASLTEVEP